MINNFQKAMLNNKEIAWQIIKVFHPDILISYDNNYNDKIINALDRLKISLKYDWIMIDCKIQTHISVSLGIKFECHLMSGDKPLHLFEKELKNNKFKVWRFASDSKYEIEKEKRFDYLRGLYNNLVNDILNQNNISKPTAKQMSDYYHSD
jgi:hypothetical protein